MQFADVRFDTVCRKEVIIGVYLILFGAATAGLEFQIPPPVAKYASFMFSFLGRGVCKSCYFPYFCYLYGGVVPGG